MKRNIFRILAASFILIGMLSLQACFFPAGGGNWGHHYSHYSHWR